jgi:PAS domain S-box-containing protein
MMTGGHKPIPNPDVCPWIWIRFGLAKDAMPKATRKSKGGEDRSRRRGKPFSRRAGKAKAKAAPWGSEVSYRDLFATLTEGCALHETLRGPTGIPCDYRFLDVNPAFERLTRLKREDIVGKTWQDLFSGDDPFWVRIYGEAAQRGTPVRFENRLEKFNRDYDVIAFHPAHDRFAVLLMDVSERKQADVDLRESREDLNRAQAVAQTGSWRLNLERNEVLWSDETHRIFGFPKGIPLSFESFLRCIHPDDREQVEREWQAALRGEPYDIEHRIVVDGATKWVRERATLEFDENGSARGAFGITQDITELRQARAALEKRLGRFELLAHTAGELLRAADPQRVVASLCRSFMGHLDCHVFFNYLKGEKTGHLHLNAYAGIPVEEARRIEWLNYGDAICRRAARDRTPIVSEHIPTNPDPRTDLVKSYGIKAYACHPLLGSNGEAIGILSFGTRRRETFRPDELSLMKAVADQVAVAMLRMDGERALREALALLDAVFESAPIGLAFCDRDLRFVRLNKALAELNGRSVEEHLGRRPDEVVPDGSEIQGIMSSWKKLLVTGQPILGVEISGQIPKHPGERRYYLGSWFPVKVAGESIGVAATVLDVTEHRKAQEGLKRSHSRSETMIRERAVELEDTVRALENEVAERRKLQNRLQQLSRVFMDAADPIIIEDLNGTIIEVNHEAETAYGWSREELIGRPMTEILPSERHERADWLRGRCRRGEYARDWEGLRQHRSGKSIPVLLTAFPLLNEFGKVAAVATIAKDITVRKEMEARLKESRERLQDISRRTVQTLETDRQSMSRELHDSIGGNLAALKFILEEALDLTSKGMPAAATLDNAILFLSQTIKESKRIAAMMRPLTLDDLGVLTTLRGYIKQFAEQYKNIRVDSRIDLQEEDVTEEQKIMLYRILQEALTNAAKHSHADAVLVNLKIAAGSIVLEVKDNGSGFDSQQVMSREDPLSGLGLKSMRERAEICRGAFSIETGAGRGTLLRIALPAEAGLQDERTETSVSSGRTGEQNH